MTDEDNIKERLKRELKALRKWVCGPEGEGEETHAKYKEEIKMGRTVERIKVQNYVDVVKAHEGMITAEEIRTVEVDAIVDTGATFVCLGRKEIEQLGLLIHKTVNITTANGKTTRRTYKGAEIELRGRTFQMEVMENDDDTPPLIGYLLLEALDLVVDPKTQRVIFNPAHEGKWVADCYPCGN